MKKATNVTNWLAKLVFGFALLFGGTQALAMKCSGSLVVQKPEDWSTMYLVVDGTFLELPSTALSGGWYTVEIANYGGQYAENFFFAEKENGWNDRGITTAVYNVSGWDQADKFTCANVDSSTTGSFYVAENPEAAGTTYYGANAPNAYYYYFLPPDDQMWNSSVPMISSDGGVTGVEMYTDPDRCGWFYFVWFSDTPPDSVVIFRDSDAEREELIGSDGYAGAGSVVNPILLRQKLDSSSTRKIFHISDDAMWPLDANESALGFFDTDPGVTGKCEYKLAAWLYDTDASLHGAFTCDAYPNVASNGCYSASAPYNYAGGGGANTVPCIGVTKNIVADTLGSDNKPIYNESSGCFVSTEAFNAMFNETEGVNSRHCRDIYFSRASDGLWEFDSYNTTYGAYTPLNDLVDSISGGSCTGTCATAATLREGLGNVSYGAGTLTTINATAKKMFPAVTNWAATNPVTGLPYIDSYPVEAGEFGDGKTPDVYDNTTWDLRTKHNNNQQFCFESHANFKYKKGLEFYFRGDDDIWVFIGGRLAVDLGGTHLAAPGAVNLDTMKTKDGDLLIEGKTYNLDIFFCDRRTTMSNVRVKTNMYIQQSQGITYDKDASYTGEGIKYNLCYEETGDGDCESSLTGLTNEAIKYCGDSIEGHAKIAYSLYKGSSIFSLNGEIYDLTYFETQLAAGVTKFFGAVDLSNRYSPIINKTAVTGLPSGTYKFVAFVGTKKVSWLLRVAGTLDVLTATGEDSTKTVYNVVTSAMADVRIPVIISAIGDALDNGHLDVDLASAVDEQYSLTVTGGIVVYADSNSTTPLTTASKRTVGATGVDTVWATIPLSAMTEAEMTGTITARKAILTLTFKLPAIAFVDSSYTTQLNGYGNWDISPDSLLYRGAYYTAYVMMFDPTTGAICTSCNYGLELVTTASSEGLTGVSTLGIVDGKGVINFRSSKLTPKLDSTKENSPLDSAYFSVATMESALITATWNGLVFTEPPVPIPNTVLVYDTKGSAVTYAGLDPAFTNAEYLDGIADSLTILYHRPFHVDSLPDSIVVNWSKVKEEALTITRDEILKAAKVLIADSLYDSVLTFSGLELSKDVQTANSGSLLSSYATYKKNGIVTSGSFDAPFTDKVAPIITRANISEMSEGLFQVKISLSEPVMVSEENAGEVKSLFAYFLRSATDLVGSAKYQVVAATNATVVDSNVTMFYNSASGTIPQSGDYVRAVPGLLTDQNGNSLTDYNATVPSPWMLLEGDAASTIASIKMGTVDNTVDVNADVIVPHFLGIYDSVGVLLEEYPNTLGYIIKTDMGNILTDPTLDSLIAAGKIKLEDVKLKYELDIFTNLGTFVAHKSGSIACTDEFFGGDCRENRGYVYLAWDMVTSKGRIAGTGAYIAKLSTHAVVPSQGKKGKHNVTQTWGVRRTTAK